MSLHVEWVGLACFRLWTNDGSVIATDPYAPDVLGLTEPEELALQIQADVVIASSLTDTAHSNLGLVKGNPEVINALDVAEGKHKANVNDVPVIAVPASETPDHPEGPKDCALYAFRAGGIWVLHMGDLGYGLSNEQLAPFAGHCDLLLALAGEGLTLPIDELDPMINFLDPSWIVPMHYNVPPVTGKLQVMSKVEVLLDQRSQDPVVFTRDDTTEFPLDTAALGRPTIVVLEPSGYTRTG